MFVLQRHELCPSPSPSFTTAKQKVRLRREKSAKMVRIVAAPFISDLDPWSTYILRSLIPNSYYLVSLYFGFVVLNVTMFPTLDFTVCLLLNDFIFSATNRNV